MADKDYSLPPAVEDKFHNYPVLKIPVQKRFAGRSII
jgi:hypothetical protein